MLSAATLISTGLLSGAVAGSAEAAHVPRLSQAGVAATSTASSTATALSSLKTTLPRMSAPKAKPTGTTHQVSVSWKAVTLTSGKQVSYQVHRSPGNVTFTTTSLSRTVGNLANGKTYTFLVRAKLGSKVGPWSPAAKATPFRRAGAPTAVKVGPEPASRTSFYGYAFLRWCPAKAGTYPVHHYSFRIDGGTWQTGGEQNYYEYPSDSKCLMVIKPLSSFGLHRFSVRAVDTKGHVGTSVTVTENIPMTTLALGFTPVDPSGSCTENCYTPTATITNNYFPNGSSVALTVNGVEEACTLYGGPQDNGTVVLSTSIRNDDSYEPCVLISGDTVGASVGTLFGQRATTTATVPTP